jgi:hypothetical protein
MSKLAHFVFDNTSEEKECSNNDRDEVLDHIDRRSKDLVEVVTECSANESSSNGIKVSDPVSHGEVGDEGTKESTNESAENFSAV